MAQYSSTHWLLVLGAEGQILDIVHLKETVTHHHLSHPVEKLLAIGSVLPLLNRIYSLILRLLSNRSKLALSFP